MLFSSSKRALISIATATCLWFSAARIRWRTTSAFAPARYSVILIASTSGSSDACRRNDSTGPNESYGWCSRMSDLRTSAKMSALSGASFEKRGTNGGSRRSCRGSAASDASARSPKGADSS